MDIQRMIDAAVAAAVPQAVDAAVAPLETKIAHLQAALRQGAIERAALKLKITELEGALLQSIIDGAALLPAAVLGFLDLAFPLNLSKTTQGTLNAKEAGHGKAAGGKGGKAGGKGGGGDAKSNKEMGFNVKARVQDAVFAGGLAKYKSWRQSLDSNGWGFEPKVDALIKAHDSDYRASFAHLEKHPKRLLSKLMQYEDANAARLVEIVLTVLGPAEAASIIDELRTEGGFSFAPKDEQLERFRKYLA